MAPWNEPLPRRARYLIPAGVPHRGEIAAACALVLVLAHLLLAQLTLGLTLAFTGVARVSRWRPWWLLAPAAAGLAWTLAIGPAAALAGFTTGPAAVLWHLAVGHLAGGHLTGGHVAGRAWRPLAGFGGVRGWLAGQFPLALIGGAAEAWLLGRLTWLHTDEWAVRPPRPGALAALRRVAVERQVRAGLVVTRRGCALGVQPGSGAVAEMRWAEAAGGAVVVGAVKREVAAAALQVVHAALRRRKPVIVLAAAADAAALTRALGMACLAAGVPLLAEAGMAESGASGLWRHGPRAAPGPKKGTPVDPGQPVDLKQVVAGRCAALLAADGADLAARACARLTALAADLARIGVDGDAVVWVPEAERVPTQSLRELLRAAPAGGLAVLASTCVPEAASELSWLAATVLIRRVADPGLAASLARRTGTRLLPRAQATAEPVPAGPLQADPLHDGLLPGGLPVPPGPAIPAGPAVLAGPAGPAGPAVPPGQPVADLVPVPAVAARTLLALGPAEFVLAAGGPRPRLIAPGTLVTARLPRRSLGAADSGDGPA